MFLGTKDDTIYKLDAENISIDLTITCEKLTNTGEWQVITGYTTDSAKGTITFSTPPGESPVLGRDNIKIRFGVRNLDTISQINKCTIATVFGYDGNNNRLFVSGNKDFCNYDWHSEIDNPEYFPDTNVTKMGLSTAPIISYARVNNGKLAIFKEVTDTDCTAYYRKTAMFNSKEVFPLGSGTKNVGCIATNATATLQNEPLILSNQGVFGITSVSNNDERYAMLRSYYINGKLLKEANLKDATAVSYKGKYYLAINNHVYVADSRYRSNEKDSSTSNFQYEWYYFTNIPVRVWFVWKDELYFGDNIGNICKFRTKDDVNLYKDFDLNVEAYWETPYLSFGSLTNAKTIKKVILALNPQAKSEIEVGYILKKGKKLIINKVYNNILNSFSKVMQAKKKAKKFMYAKIYMESLNPVNMSFTELSIQYIVGGKYRGD